MPSSILEGETERRTSVDASVVESTATVKSTGGPASEAVPPLNVQNNEFREEAIRTLAHQKWESAGCPAGDGVEFWLEAEREVDSELSHLCPSPE